jgi:uncharacterized protein with von Willebrand factor type A (vWA) domain
MPSLFRYSHWDGSQRGLAPDENAVLAELSDHLLTHGDISSALRALTRSGLPTEASAARTMGTQELLDKIQQRRQQVLSQHDPSSILRDVQAKLDAILTQERRGIQRELQRAEKKTPASASPAGKDISDELQQKLLDALKRRAQLQQAKLSAIRSDDPAKAIQSLRDYEFMDPQAKAAFDDLLRSLEQQVAQALFKDLVRDLNRLTPGHAKAMKEMLQDLNHLAEQKLRGEEPNFDAFAKHHQEAFGGRPPPSLDDFLAQIQQQVNQMQALLNSLSPQQSKQLQELIQTVLGDPALHSELARLAANLEQLHPSDFHFEEHSFFGDQKLDLRHALKFMDDLRKMDMLERQLRRAQQAGEPKMADPELAGEVLGQEARQALEQLATLTDRLEQTGYIRAVNGRYEITPAGVRKIGQRALHEIFTLIKRDRSGGHPTDHTGPGTDFIEATKPYEFGDAFSPHLQRTIMNAVKRGGTGLPVQLQASDFEVHHADHLSQSSTVLMVDLSLSMAMRGNFSAAKKVALALDNLIRAKFPRDKLFIVGFSTYAREVKAARLPYLSWDEFDPYTNIQHGLAVSQQLLSRIKIGTRQIIMISDGEPTAHIEGGQLFLQYPPSPRTLRATLAEVRRCTQQNIVINTFMLDRNSHLVDFVDQMTRINRGRVFYTTADRLGQYILVDYLGNRKQKMLA